MSAAALHHLEDAARRAPPSTMEAAARVLSAVARLLPEVDERTLGDVTGAATAYEVLLRVLEDPATRETRAYTLSRQMSRSERPGASGCRCINAPR